MCVSGASHIYSIRVYTHAYYILKKTRPMFIIIDVNTEVLHSDFVVSKPVETAEVVWVHPQSELVSVCVYGNY